MKSELLREPVKKKMWKIPHWVCPPPPPMTESVENFPKKKLKKI